MGIVIKQDLIRTLTKSLQKRKSCFQYGSSLADYSCDEDEIMCACDDIGFSPACGFQLMEETSISHDHVTAFFHGQIKRFHFSKIAFLH